MGERRAFERGGARRAPDDATPPTPDDLLRSVGRTVSAPEVLRAMAQTPRAAFVPPPERDLAYYDHPLPIGEDQTISQPTIVGMMVEAAEIAPTDRVLEIGTGSGWQTAILARLAGEVVSVEVRAGLRERARALLDARGVTGVEVLPAGPVLGAPERAPFDAIIVTAQADRVPAELLDQLRPGGRLVIPVGDRRMQELLVVTRTEAGERRRSLGGCRFVPLVE